MIKHGVRLIHTTAPFVSCLFFTFVVDIGLRPVVEMFTVFCVLVRSSCLVSRVSAFN
jgi:hypothetical protein